MTPEEIMKKVANEHSYDTWGDLMYDSHDHSQVECTKEAMKEYAKSQVEMKDSEHESKLKEIRKEIAGFEDSTRRTGERFNNLKQIGIANGLKRAVRILDNAINGKK